MSVSLLVLGRAMTAEASSAQDQKRGIVGAFCTEIGRPEAAANATFEAVAAALQGELLLPLRALSEGVTSMTSTFNGAPVPRAPIEAVVKDIIAHVLDGTFAEWRYTNSVGKRQVTPLARRRFARARPTAVRILRRLLVRKGPIPPAAASPGSAAAAAASLASAAAAASLASAAAVHQRLELHATRLVMVSRVPHVSNRGSWLVGSSAPVGTME